jgi:hypothetical protein
MSDAGDRLSRLSPGDRALLFEKLRQKKEKTSPTGQGSPAIPRRAGTAPPPLSFAQQRLWFLNRLAPQDPTYNVPIACLIKGRTDPVALARALAAVAVRHESLRTTFGLADGNPVQVIAPAMSVPVPVVDMSLFGPSLEHSQAEVYRVCCDLFVIPFDLEAGRCGVLRCSAWRPTGTSWS